MPNSPNTMIMMMDNKCNSNNKKFSFSNIYANKNNNDDNTNTWNYTMKYKFSSKSNSNNHLPTTPTRSSGGYITPLTTSPSQRHKSYSHKRNGSISGNMFIVTPPNDSYHENVTPASSLSNTPTKRTSNNNNQKKSLSVVVPNDIDDLNPIFSPGFNEINTFTNTNNNNSNISSDEDEGVSSHSYTHELSPKLTIQNTNEQIRRNSVGTYSSLTDFVKQNHINVDGRIFVDKPQTPKIDLDI
ncbi:similar to Saccharomyces cerevisiae YBR157C ICS2 Protein of unknown function [Maudiozyma saulgeensis]|uniref:Uncharacterized protein n=1 Tax=Maudiozyma saulgeensis TaxID=1789683 RepID=A0A1X7R626_9SACH|nr:similar to Saccharomyces cerevisiae YBR157C ICS2 Protein of unknown function [Kazachstania saulgeensis]